MFFFVENPYAYIFGSVFLVSLISIIGVMVIAIHERILRKFMLYFVSFSTGALLGNVFLHLLPEVIEHSDDLSQGLFIVLIGILISFMIEKFIHWRHCHSLECASHVKPVGSLVIIGDAAHNIIDGILIATSYLVSIPLGIATTTAVILHEIPQEFGDFAVLLHSGFSKGKALLFNFLSALTAFLGVFIVFGLAQNVGDIETILLPLAAGNFLYIAGADQIPELHTETSFKSAFFQLLFMIAGIALMYGLAASKLPH